MLKNNKAFTLIELLAVIVILAVIALITAPLVMNIVGEADTNSFKNSAHGIMQAGENAYTQADLKREPIKTSIAFGNDDPNNNVITVKGKKPNNGGLHQNKSGEIAIYMWRDDKLCVYKDYADSNVKLENNITLDICKSKGISV